jgi:glycerol-3-phosphate O-acyltransferase/dihydroxyacetone phosphate acyltransferase
MTERLLHALIDLIVNTFFRRIDVVGLENVPADGPLIFAGNHPNALMDGFLLISKCGRRPIHFLAASKLWKYSALGKALDAVGAVPVYRREDHDGKLDNSDAFERLYEVIESGNCMGVFPEGISHAESQLVKLKTGTARIALKVSARGNTTVQIIPCGLTYIHRHRFRSQVLLEFGEPIVIGEEWVRKYESDEVATVREFTDCLADELANVTLNAPDWSTLRFIQTARRLYKPTSAKLTPGAYVDLSRRFVDRYLAAIDDPELQQFRIDAENYQSRLDFLGLKDHQLRQPIDIGATLRKLLSRCLMTILLLPLAIPGAVLHLPVGWIAAWVGDRFSYEQDDVATLKVMTTILLLPLLYLAAAILVGLSLGFWWGVATGLLLPLSFFFSLYMVEAEVGLLLSILSLLRISRLPGDVAELRQERARLVTTVRTIADRLADPDIPRLFNPGGFSDQR